MCDIIHLTLGGSRDPSLIRTSFKIGKSMILGTSINWKPLLLAIKEIDDSAIRENVKGEYDYSEFLTVMNQAFPGIDARKLIFCSDIFETSPKVALSINNIIPTVYSKGFVCITGNILQWRDFVSFFSEYKHIDEDVTIRCQAYRSALIKIDKDIFV